MFLFRFNPPFHFEFLVFHLNYLSPHLKFYQPFIPTLIQTSLYASDNLSLCPHFRVIAMRSPSSTVRIDVFDAGWVQHAAESVVLDFRFPVRNARVSMGLNDVKGSRDSKADFVFP